MNGVIEEVLKLLHSDLVNDNIVVDRNLAQKLPEVSGDRVQLQQVLINLILNGCDAMANTKPSDRRLWLQTESNHGQVVKVTVGDHGCGIGPIAWGKAFEPFVSTKPNGMGMGLAVCKTIISAHDGQLWAESNPGTGALAFALPMRGRRQNDNSPSKGTRSG